MKMDVHMKTAVSKPLHLISVLSYLKNIKISFDSNVIRESSAMWLFQYFIPKPAKDALPNQVAADNKKHNEGRKPSNEMPCGQQFVGKE